MNVSKFVESMSITPFHFNIKINFNWCPHNTMSEIDFILQIARCTETSDAADVTHLFVIQPAFVAARPASVLPKCWSEFSDVIPSRPSVHHHAIGSKLVVSDFQAWVFPNIFTKSTFN